MRTKKRKRIAFLIAAMFCFFPVRVLAAQINISSGLVMDAEEVESTFDDGRLIYGEAEPGTEITFTVSRLNCFGEAEESYREDVTVGSMGLFSATLPLEKGDNYICMISGEQTQEIVVKRVAQEVKSQLQNMIALPGVEEAF